MAAENRRYARLRHKKLFQNLLFLYCNVDG